MSASSIDGLTTAECAARRARDSPNELPHRRTRSSVERFVQHVAEPLSAVLGLTAIITLTVLSKPAEGLPILAIVALNSVIATVQEARAEEAIESLNSLAAPTARVRRDGRSITVAARDVVVGDLVEIETGDRVPADLDLIDVASLGVDKAILTGEAFPVDKRAGGDGPERGVTRPRA